MQICNVKWSYPKPDFVKKCLSLETCPFTFFFGVCDLSGFVPTGEQLPPSRRLTPKHRGASRALPLCAQPVSSNQLVSLREVTGGVRKLPSTWVWASEFANCFLSVVGRRAQAARHAKAACDP